MLANKNAHKRDKYIEFDELPHIYTVKGEGGYTSVTKWVHSHFEQFNADKIIKKMMEKEDWDSKTNKYYGMTPQSIKQMWSDNGKAASAAGTKLHNDIEDFYNGKKVNNDSLEYGYFKNFYESHKDLMVYRTEWMIYHEELKFAGSIDVSYIMPDGSLILGDWKRCKDIKKNNPWGKYAKTSMIDYIPDTNYWHYSLQLNMYRYILEEKYDKKVKKLFLICIHPDKDDYECITVPDMQNEIRSLLKISVSS